MSLAPIRYRKDFLYSLRNHRIYTPDDEDIRLLNPHIAFNGEILWDVIKACPKEGWVEILEHDDGNNYNRDSKVRLDAHGSPVIKLLRGKVEIVEPIISKTSFHKA